MGTPDGIAGANAQGGRDPRGFVGGSSRGLERSVCIACVGDGVGHGRSQE